MEVIYCRSSLRRRKRFQIITSIIQKEKEWYVIKKAARKEAEDHINKIYSNEQLMKKYHKEYLVESSYINGRIITPYIKGQSLGERLRNALLKKDKKQIQELIELWKKIIIGQEDNLVLFQATEQFKTIFGEADELEGSIATKVSNCDCSGDNIIILDDGSIRVIDLEWFFDIAVPLELNVYRVLKVFYSFNQDACSWSDLISYGDISLEHCAVYDRCLSRFRHYITQDDNGINYDLLGQIFKEPQIELSISKRQLYVFPKEVEKKYRKIALYGAGKVGKDYAAYIKSSAEMELCFWVDKNAKAYQKAQLSVCSPQILEQYKNMYDIILIAVMDEKDSREIKSSLMEVGIVEEKIYWSRPRLL